MLLICPYSANLLQFSSQFSHYVVVHSVISVYQLVHLLESFDGMITLTAQQTIL